MFRKMNISFKRKGFVLMPAILSIFILGMLGVSLASIYSDTFSVLTAGKEASLSGSYAGLESEYLKALGYDEAGTGAHNWGTMEKFLGDDEGKQWESKVEKLRHIDISEDNGVDIYRISTRKKGDTAASYSVEVPLSSQVSSGAFGAPDYSRTFILSYTKNRIYDADVGWYIEYTSIAPDNGYIRIQVHGDESYLDYPYAPGTQITVNSINVGSFSALSVSSYYIAVFPVAKGDIIKMIFGDPHMYFIPCKK